MNDLDEVRRSLRTFADPEKIPDYMRYFKTGKGEYGEGDKFLGVRMPDIRKVVKQSRFLLDMDDVTTLLCSAYHEERMLALLYLVAKYKSKRMGDDSKDEIYDLYINNTSQINNWDLVDVTCPHIVGAHLLDKERTLLYDLARSDDLWERRISIISTFAFIKAGEYDDTLKIADILIDDSHDLIHKAVGWALRNVGIKELNTELGFLESRYKMMPRTMLRYAIEKFEEPLRQSYLKDQV